MDGSPVQILCIERNEETQKSIYYLRFDALHDILYKINDIEVAVISIAGPSRQGKSFLLSYLLRYLSNPNDNNWIGNKDNPLLGFHWNHGIEPKTKGIWIWSKPFVVEHSGNKKAILILDSQGVYDEYTDIRDWSTIVGITLLTSSCFIFNVFTDIQENVLTQLETFVNYGLLAISKDTSNRPAFQRLLFLIRDWNHARVFNYGHSGGKEYITQKLMIKTNQPQASQRTRQLIRKCFEDVNCYLMPEPGPERENSSFSGSVAQLSDRFVAKLKELFSVLLTPDSLKPKVINGNAINGRDLLKFFEVFVEKFNGDELPQPIDLVEAVAKTTDLNLIYRLKEKYVSDMNTDLKKVHFLSSYELKVLHDSVLKNILEIFKNSRKSQNYEVVKQINIIFETEIRNTYKSIHLENEKKRDKIANNTIATSVNIYTKNMLSYMKDKCFIKSANFDEYSNKSKQMAKKLFTDQLSVDEIEVYAPYLLKIHKLIEESENYFKSENERLKLKTKQISSRAIEDSLNIYIKQMQTILDENIFITDEMFNQSEIEMRAHSLGLFTNRCIGTKEFIIKSEKWLKLKLNEAKADLYAKNRNRMKNIVRNTHCLMNNVFKYFNEIIIEKKWDFCCEQNLCEINNLLKEETLIIFKQKCMSKDSDFISSYIKKLEFQIDKTLNAFIKEFENQTLETKSIVCSDEIDGNVFKCISPDFKGKLSQNTKAMIYIDSYKKDLLKKFEIQNMSEKLNNIYVLRANHFSNTFKNTRYLSSGCFGIVHESEVDKTRFAVKQIPFNNKEKTDVCEEIRIIINLDDKYVVKCYDFWIEENYFQKKGFDHYINDGIKSGSSHQIFDPHNDLLLNIQMELCYKNLKQIIEILNKEFGVKSFEEMTIQYIYISNELFKETLQCLNYLHKHKPPIIHRDLKPSNILITYGLNGRFVKLGDFGLSVFHKSESQSHTTGVGDLNYMAPEVKNINDKNTTKYGVEADIYSLGMILKDLFNYDITRDIKSLDYKDITTNNIRNIKIGDLISVMTNTISSFRPTCDQVLNEKQLWDLDLRQIITDDIFVYNTDILCSFKNFFIKTKLNYFNLDK